MLHLTSTRREFLRDTTAAVTAASATLPYWLAVRMKSEHAAEAAAKKPGARRTDAYTVECEVTRHCDVVKWITGAGGE